MASSNHENIQGTKSADFDNISKSTDATFVDPKPNPQPNSHHGVRDEEIKQPDSKVDQALRFLQSVFESGDSSTNLGGIECDFYTKVHTYVFNTNYILIHYFLCDR